MLYTPAHTLAPTHAHTPGTAFHVSSVCHVHLPYLSVDIMWTFPTWTCAHGLSVPDTRHTRLRLAHALRALPPTHICGVAMTGVSYLPFSACGTCTATPPPPHSLRTTHWVPLFYPRRIFPCLRAMAGRGAACGPHGRHPQTAGRTRRTCPLPVPLAINLQALFSSPLFHRTIAGGHFWEGFP